MHKKKIIVFSYFYSPCNLTPSERIQSFVDALSKQGYYPIIVTRNWDNAILNSTTDVFKSSGDKVRIEQCQQHEIHYLPYKSSLKDKLFLRFDGTKFYPIYLITALIFSIWNLVCIKKSAYSYFYIYLKKLLDNCPEIKMMVTSASPFEFFGISYLLSKRNNINWIADYRDDWSTNEMQYSDNFAKRLLQKISRHYEVKWLATASDFVTVSSRYCNKIKSITHLKGAVLTNGFQPENYLHVNTYFEKFTIVYTGSIYPIQPIEKPILAFIKFITTHNIPHTKIQMIFIGILSESPIFNRIKNIITGYENYFHITPRLPKTETIHIQSNAHLLLACAYGNLKGIPGSKLYEYLALKKRILFYPTDHDIIEDTLTKTNQGLICETQDDFIEYLANFYQLFIKNKFQESTQINTSEIEQYARSNQAQTLIRQLNQIEHE
ncbi:MAG TPA: hypothetical protein PLU10_02470 [Chitinophagaceae bacterium]|nr:hypothetical protein [Chitinophagaceae bacterium]